MRDDLLKYSKIDKRCKDVPQSARFKRPQKNGE
jgi:hypothetical protein